MSHHRSTIRSKVSSNDNNSVNNRDNGDDNGIEGNLNFTNELKGLMYGFGDKENPDSETAELLQEYVIEYIQNISLAAYRRNKRKGSNEISLRDLLYVSSAELEIKVSYAGRGIECRRVVLSEVMKQRSLFFGGNGAVVLNYYPLLRIETSSIPDSSPVFVSVSVIKPDLNFLRYNGRVALQVRGYVESW